MLSGRQGCDGSQIQYSWHLNQLCLDATVTQGYDVLMGLGHSFALIYKALYALGSDYPGNSLPWPWQLRLARMLLLMVPTLKAQEIRNGWFCFVLYFFFPFSGFAPPRPFCRRLRLARLPIPDGWLPLSFPCFLEEPSSGCVLLFTLRRFASFSWNRLRCARYISPSSQEWIFKPVQEMTAFVLPKT